MNTQTFSVAIGDKTLTAEFNDLANQANGSVMLRYGDTVVLATATMSSEKREGLNYFPLSVEYEEKFYAAGQILGSRFVRREGRPSDEAVLSGRAVDRTIRPLFEQHIRNDVQIVITVLSIDKDDPGILAINAASLALATSDIPWGGPVSAVRIGKHAEGDLAVNPEYTFRENEHVSFDMVACGKDGNINMIEVGAHETPENGIVEALELASEELEKLQVFQKEIVKALGKEKMPLEKPVLPKTMLDLFEKHIRGSIDGAIFGGSGKEGINALKREWETLLQETLPEEDIHIARAYYEDQIDRVLHSEAVGKERRADGRTMDAVRPLYAQAGGISPILHGSGTFYRGGTHILSALTLGGPDDSQIIDGMEVQTKKRFIHHYNFPPFSVGETGRVGGFNRRMIGHGALAEKALSAVIPSAQDFPYTIRIVSEALASNGSTSMGSVCGSTLALMDAGVPIKAPVAGIAMGLMMNEEGEHTILTDIQGPEDHHGDMDFKVAGTRDGVTAVQMDVKVEGVPVHILAEAFERAKSARLVILDAMALAISEPRPEISPNAPHVLVMHIKKEKIGLVIGGGGKTINGIKDLTAADISIEDDGTVYITGKNGGAEKAQEIIEGLVKEYEVGERASGTVTRILDFGAFVKIGPPSPVGNGGETEGLVHISEIAPFRIEKVTDVLKVGDTVPVVVKEIDSQGRINLSIKGADAKFAENKGVKPASNANRNDNQKNGNGERHTKPRRERGA